MKQVISTRNIGLQSAYENIYSMLFKMNKSTNTIHYQLWLCNKWIERQRAKKKYARNIITFVFMVKFSTINIRNGISDSHWKQLINFNFQIIIIIIIIELITSTPTITNYHYKFDVWIYLSFHKSVSHSPYPKYHFSSML